VLGGKQSSRDASADADLGVDVFEVVAHSVLTEHQLSSDLAPTHSTRQQAQDLDLALGKTCRLGC